MPPVIVIIDAMLIESPPVPETVLAKELLLVRSKARLPLSVMGPATDPEALPVASPNSRVAPEAIVTAPEPVADPDVFAATRVPEATVVVPV